MARTGARGINLGTEWLCSGTIISAPPEVDDDMAPLLVTTDNGVLMMTELPLTREGVFFGCGVEGCAVGLSSLTVLVSVGEKDVTSSGVVEIEEDEEKGGNKVGTTSNLSNSVYFIFLSCGASHSIGISSSAHLFLEASGEDEETSIGIGGGKLVSTMNSIGSVSISICSDSATSSTSLSTSPLPIISRNGCSFISSIERSTDESSE